MLEKGGFPNKSICRYAAEREPCPIFLRLLEPQTSKFWGLDTALY